jgi:O-antigen ligase
MGIHERIDPVRHHEKEKKRNCDKPMSETSNRKHFHQMIRYFLILCIAFFIPVYGKILPPLIAFLVLNWLIDGSFVKTIPLLFRDPKRRHIISFALLYLLYIAGLFYSRNMIYGLFDLEVKLSLLVFPLIFATAGEPVLDAKKINTVLKTFVGGCLAGSVIFLGYSSYNEIVYHVQDSFYYTRLSWYYHPSYLAMYFGFAIPILIYWLVNDHKSLSWLIKTGMIVIMLYFLVFIILLSSKAGLLALALTLVSYIIILIVKKGQWLYGLVTLAVAMGAFYFGMKIFPFAANRIYQAEKDFSVPGDSATAASRSTGSRIQIWKSALDIIRKNPVLGVGTGDVKDELMKRYSERKIEIAIQHKLNAHNQYLQTFVALGLAGLIVLLAMFIVPARMAFRKEHYLYFMFLVVFSVNILVESMFETQAGVVFYAFFNTILFIAMDAASVEPVKGAS